MKRPWYLGVILWEAVNIVYSSADYYIIIIIFCGTFGPSLLFMEKYTSQTSEVIYTTSLIGTTKLAGNLRRRYLNILSINDTICRLSSVRYFMNPPCISSYGNFRWTFRLVHLYNILERIFFRICARFLILSKRFFIFFLQEKISFKLTAACTKFSKSLNFRNRVEHLLIPSCRMRLEKFFSNLNFDAL